jgi:hypothetical protein
LFKRIQKENPGWGSNVILANAVYGRNFSKDRISRMFKELVDKDEYSQSDKKALLEFLYLHTKGVKRTKNEGKLPHREEKTEEMDTDDISKDEDSIDDIIKRVSKPIPPGELPF